MLMPQLIENVFAVVTSVSVNSVPPILLHTIATPITLLSQSLIGVSGVGVMASGSGLGVDIISDSNISSSETDSDSDGNVRFSEFDSDSW